jgi:hypothetical protein
LITYSLTKQATEWKGNDLAHQQVAQALAGSRSQIERPRLQWPEVEKIIATRKVDQLPNPTLARVFDDLPANIGNLGYRANASGFGLMRSGAQIDSLDRSGGRQYGSSQQQPVSGIASMMRQLWSRPHYRPAPFCIVIATLHHSPGHLLPFTVLTFSLCWQSAALNAHINLYGF